MNGKQKVMTWAVLSAACAMLASVAAAQTSSLTLVVVNRGDNSVAFLDPANGKILGLVKVGEQPHGLAVSDDGKLAFVANTVTTRSGGALISPSISVIDIAAQTEVRRLNTGPFSRPHGVLYAGGKLYFTAEGYRLVGCYDPATNEIDWMIGHGQDRNTAIVMNSDGTKLVAENRGSASVTIMERRSDPAKWTAAVDWSVTVIPVGAGPHGFDLSPDEKEVWAVSEIDHTISIIDVTAKKIIQTVKVSTEAPTRLTFTPDGQRVFITDDLGLLVLDARTRQEVRRVKLDVRRPHEDILFSPDGAHVYIPNMVNIEVLDMKTLAVTGHLTSGAFPEGLAWSTVRPRAR